MADELAAEDALRLQVLLAGEVHAVRIDEGARTLHALTAKGEARIALNPRGNLQRYLQRVRELLGGHAFGTPGGYPVHLRRWLRLGRAGADTLQALLKLGDPEAVAAVAHAEGLTDELARRAWWASQPAPAPEIARAMLQAPAVRTGTMGPVLVEHLVETLPFESDPAAALQTVRAVLASGLLTPPARARLWASAQQRPHYLIAFLEYAADDLPAEAARALPPDLPDAPAARLLARCYSGVGQAYLRAAEAALERPPTHEAVYLLLDVLGRYFADGGGAVSLPVRAAEAAALTALARVSQQEAAPILTRTTAVGPLMRRHLEPVLAPIVGHLRALRGLG
jgi:hypothetical protein